MLTIEPMGGLCNRLRAIDSAVALGRVIEQPVRVIWAVNNRFGSPFTRLFQVPPQVCSIENVTFGPFRPNWLHVLRQMDFRRPRSYCRNDDIKQLLRSDFDFQKFGARTGLHFKTLHRFFEPFGIKQLFVPVPELQKIIDDRCAEFDRCIGVHIRRDDHEPSKVYSPTAQFIDRMQLELDRSGCEMFFVATDDESEEVKLRQCFGERIVTHPKRSLNRDNAEAAEDAVVDLFCLSRTNKIIGSAFSSFTSMAAEINQIPLELATEELPHPSLVKW